MKKIIFLSFVMVLSIVSFAYPHSPYGITIAVNAQTVNIKVYHPVSEPASHYIKKVVVRVNGAEVKTDEFISQTGNYQSLELEIPGLKKGDSLVITAYCSRYGELTRDTKVE
ncbi:MAG: hypothetical protein PHH68_04560 [Candidatus Omnitrophica bacterium]|nr:hypothetical protein [Candidatus Omnitrophota bacterium]